MKKIITVYLGLLICFSSAALAFEEEVISSSVESPEMARIEAAAAPLCNLNCKVKASSRDGSYEWIANYPCTVAAGGGCICNSHGWPVADDRCIY